MFTGLIETMGTVVAVRACGLSAELCVQADVAGFEAELGGSVAVDGVCLTLEKRDSAGRMFFTAVAETLKRTTFDRAAAGRRVNLERAARVGGRLDGHIVLGHIDAVGKIVHDENTGASIMRTIEVPRELSQFIAEKGSIAIDGISLTIAKVNKNAVTLSLIPATIDKTTMSIKKVGNMVNIECDILARYIYRMMETGALNRFVDTEKIPVDKTESIVDKMNRLGF